jgi:hypothetical protein
MWDHATSYRKQKVKTIFYNLHFEKKVEEIKNWKIEGLQRKAKF